MNGGFPPTHWPKAGGAKISVEGSFASNDVTLLTDAALRGLGITALPMLLVGVLLKRGDLTRVLPELIHAESRVAIVFPEREFMPPQVPAFADVLVAWAPTVIDAARISERRWPPPRERGVRALRPTRSSS
jgi:DNA-binding transcriptional LysR family regulator